MKRREFIAGLGSVTAWPLAARAQQADRMRRVGVLMGWTDVDPEARSWLAAFVGGLQKFGWSDGVNVRIEPRWMNADASRARAFAKELVELQPEVILAATTPATVAVQRETRTIPIIFVGAADPVASGIVARLDRPSGNITGFANMEPTLAGKWLELLAEIAPGLKRAAVMFNPDAVPVSAYMPSLEMAARSFKIVLSTAHVHSDAEIETAVIALGREPGGGLVVIPGPWIGMHRVPIILAAARNNIPVVYGASLYARAGGLLTYGSDIADNSRRAASYVDRILRGAKPSDLPVQLPVKYEMVVNLKAAKALGLTVPQSILLRADEVIE
jgi:putative tryptophan/tyrosine transport system substrate-binding protein